ncbi:hypothetical protein HYALB_00008804 [Hymenoscyphus albidus]|uniref:Uncharacterized protein n=1 Tax=Hymenoscyphus albidus TaxID=595503 RepID=A0A9N9LZJ2_9HELO|nr:hypothetical protein HYALB_00008804 [Hymenoscyphus albidus]
MWDQWHVIKRERDERGEKQELLPRGLIEELEWLIDIRGGAGTGGWTIDSATRFQKKKELHLYITKPITGPIDNLAESRGFIPRNPLGFSETEERIALRPDRELGRRRQGWYPDGDLCLRRVI